VKKFFETNTADGTNACTFVDVDVDVDVDGLE
jgi:hypothetical protein